MERFKVTTQEQMALYIDQVWHLLVDSYANVSGGLHYDSPAHLLEDTVCWEICLLNNRVLAVTIFKAKHGLKCVAMACDRSSGGIAKEALKNLLCDALCYAWMEVSEGAEKFIFMQCNGRQYIIHNSLVRNLLNKDEVIATNDGYHYQREIMSQIKTKVIVGTPNKLEY